MKKPMLACLAAVVLSGCQSNPTFNYAGVQYDNENNALAALDRTHQTEVDKVQTMPAPISEKTLIVGIPSLKNFQKTIKTYSGDKSNSSANRIYSYLRQTGYKSNRHAADAIRKRGIYKTTVINETDGGHLQSSQYKDVVYVYINNDGGSQWYMANQKYGKQAVTLDQGIGLTGTYNSLLNSVQTLAVQE